ncbi:unnamed protein product, partial [Owenia fusiformis]
GDNHGQGGNYHGHVGQAGQEYQPHGNTRQQDGPHGYQPSSTYREPAQTQNHENYELRSQNYNQPPDYNPPRVRFSPPSPKGGTDLSDLPPPPPPDAYANPTHSQFVMYENASNVTKIPIGNYPY